MEFLLDGAFSIHESAIDKTFVKQEDADFFFYRSVHRDNKWRSWGRVESSSKNLEAFFLATQLLLACQSKISLDYILDCLYMSSGYVCFHRGISGSSCINIDTPKKILMKGGSASRMNEQFNNIKITRTEPQPSSISSVRFFRHVLELSSNASPPFKIWFPQDEDSQDVSRPGSPECMSSIGECFDPIEVPSSSSINRIGSTGFRESTNPTDNTSFSSPTTFFSSVTVGPTVATDAPTVGPTVGPTVATVGYTVGSTVATVGYKVGSTVANVYPTSLITSFDECMDFLNNGGKIVYIDLVGSWTNMKLGSPLLKKFLEDAAHKFPGKPIVLQPLHEGLESFYRKFGFVTFKEQVKIPLSRPRKISIDSVIVLNNEEELSPELSPVSSQKLIQKPVSVQAAISTLSSIPWPIPKPLQFSATALVPTAQMAPAQMAPAQMAPAQMAPAQMAPAQMAAPNALIHRRGRKRKFEKLEEEDTSIPLEPLSFLFPPTSVVFYSLIGKDCLDFRGISLRQTMIKFK